MVLNLKIIWSLMCVVGIALSLLQGAQARPSMAWGLSPCSWRSMSWTSRRLRLRGPHAALRRARSA
jgi:hypothetical protein